MTSVSEILTEAVQTLGRAGLPDARREAEFLIAALLKKSRARLVLDRRLQIPSITLKKVHAGIKMRAERWPLAYIAHDQPFRDLILKVSPAVLIPRPETEEFVGQVLERIALEKRHVSVADIGTGSGCIAICLARSPWVKDVWAIDRSVAALKVARANARSHAIAKTIHWVKGHLLTPLIRDKRRVDFLTANLPYVATHEMKSLAPELFREPVTALHGGADGLDLIYDLIKHAPQVLNPRGWLMLEIGLGQDQAVQKLLQVGNLWQHILVRPDVAGIARFVEAQRKG